MFSLEKPWAIGCWFLRTGFQKRLVLVIRVYITRGLFLGRHLCEANLGNYGSERLAISRNGMQKIKKNIEISQMKPNFHRIHSKFWQIFNSICFGTMINSKKNSFYAPWGRNVWLFQTPFQFLFFQFLFFRFYFFLAQYVASDLTDLPRWWWWWWWWWRRRRRQAGGKNPPTTLEGG